MAICTFFGHSDCHDLDAGVLKNAIEALVHKSVDTFYVGNQGRFDSMVFSALLELEKVYPNIAISVVLAYLPIQKSAYDPYHGYSMYPEIEEGPQRFAIERRNKWMIQASDWCIVKIDRTFGGAYKFAKFAKARGLNLLNLGTVEL